MAHSSPHQNVFFIILHMRYLNSFWLVWYWFFCSFLLDTYVVWVSDLVFLCWGFDLGIWIYWRFQWLCFLVSKCQTLYLHCFWSLSNQVVIKWRLWTVCELSFVLIWIWVISIFHSSYSNTRLWDSKARSPELKSQIQFPEKLPIINQPSCFSTNNDYKHSDGIEFSYVVQALEYAGIRRWDRGFLLPGA